MVVNGVFEVFGRTVRRFTVYIMRVVPKRQEYLLLMHHSHCIINVNICVFI